MLLLAERVEFRLKVGEPGLEASRFKVAVLERLVVAVERALGAADLVGDGALLFLDRGPVGFLLAVGAVECGSDEVAVAVEAAELREDSGFELVAAQPFAVAGFAAELLPARAGVVVVEAAVAFRAHADVGALAAATPDHPGQEELGAIAAAQGEVLAALAQERLRNLERLFVDERRV